MRRRKKVWVVSPIFYVMAVSMAVMALLMWRYNRVASIIEAALAVLAAVGLVVSDVLYRRNLQNAMRSARKVLSGEERRAFGEFAMPVAVAAEAGDVVWANQAFSDELCAGGDYQGENVLRFLYPKTFRQVLGERGASVTYGGREYTVYGTHCQDSYVLYFVDDTYYKGIHREYRDKKPVVCMAAFDNREELVRDSVSGDEARITAEVEGVLRRWVVEELGGFVYRLQTGRYFFLCDDAHIEEAIQRRFRVLDQVRQIKSASHMSATLSIGVGRGAESAAQSERWARQALEMALGRGGDQAAVRGEGDSYEFFGGNSRGVERRDNVRTRVIAATLSDHVRSSDRVFIMGHRNSDLDAVGAAVGMWSVIRKGLDKPAHIVINRASTLAEPLVERIVDAYPNQEVFISPFEAMQTATEHSLLIVVDTHSVNMVESQELLEKIPRLMVIDHHRMMVSHIRNALIFFHEPAASSASEMVTELVQYIQGAAISQADAEALLAGIALDTKNFVMNTGVGTFEASAFLRRRGADTVAVKRMFANTLDNYKLKAQLVSGAEIYRGCAIATSGSTEGGDLRIAAAQAADELLSIQGVQASFVLYKVGSDVSISARSLGELNVQVILEEFGGGGHFTGAGAQLRNIGMADARRALIHALDLKLGQQR